MLNTTLNRMLNINYRCINVISLTVCLGFFSAQHAIAQRKNDSASTAINLRSTIKGNQEQPSVIYIVPWQSIDAPPAVYRPLTSTIEANLSLIDRDEFRRELRSRAQSADQ